MQASYAYGIPTGLCEWISDFLSGRSFRVVLNGSSSDITAINGRRVSGIGFLYSTYPAAHKRLAESRRQLCNKEIYIRSPGKLC